jgi:hypothetical protein
MTPIRPQDLVRLKYTPVWSGVVLCIEVDQAFIELGKQDVSWAKVLCWAPLEFLELVPDANEELLAA